MIALIDYGSGNVRSVAKALEHEGAQVSLVGSAEGMRAASAIVLPGVGAFGDCVRNLKERGLWEPIQDWLGSGKPFLGICLGYQMLFESSDETPGVAGFGYFKGQVRRFRGGNGLKVPQIGWNRLELTQPDHMLWAGLPAEPAVYYVHSYFPVPDDPSIITSTTEYGETFAASVGRDRVAAVQFHPEKSQEVGLRIMKNFIANIP